MEKFYELAPVLVVIFVFFIQHKIFITPHDLEKKHRVILSEVHEKFASTQSVESLKEQIYDICDKIDKIYDFLINHKG